MRTEHFGVCLTAVKQCTYVSSVWRLCLAAAHWNVTRWELAHYIITMLVIFTVCLTANYLWLGPVCHTVLLYVAVETFTNSSYVSVSYCCWVSGSLPCRHCEIEIEQGLTSHQTHYRSYQGRVFTGQMIQPTVSKHWRNTQN